MKYRRTLLISLCTLFVFVFLVFKGDIGFENKICYYFIFLGFTALLIEVLGIPGTLGGGKSGKLTSQKEINESSKNNAKQIDNNKGNFCIFCFENYRNLN